MMLPHPDPRTRRSDRRGFTLVELLVVIGIIAVLAALLLPVLRGGLIRARVAKAHTELGQVGIALTMYEQDYGAYPPARTYCAGEMASVDDYNELPTELVETGYLTDGMIDPFNRPHTYKYVAPGFGWANGDASLLAIWVPDGFPDGDGQATPYFDPRTAPVQWAAWSVGPGAAPTVFESDAQRLPVAPSRWYPRDPDGVIVHLRTANGWLSSP